MRVCVCVCASARACVCVCVTSNRALVHMEEDVCVLLFSEFRHFYFRKPKLRLLYKIETVTNHRVIYGLSF